MNNMSTFKNKKIKMLSFFFSPFLLVFVRIYDFLSLISETPSIRITPREPQGIEMGPRASSA